MDLTTIIGILAGIAALIGGFLWEGGELGGLFVGTAALIVFGGTFAAVIVSFPWSRLRTVPAALKFAFMRPRDNMEQLIEDVAALASESRRHGVLAIEKKAAAHPNPFLREGLLIVVDGTDPELVKQIMELEMDAAEQKYENYAKIFESAGGYAPTMGIIGTVMGLIHVLGSLTDPGALGPSIAVAFTATLYGVASANVLYLPIASKIRARSAEQLLQMELLFHGVLSVQAGDNPLLVRKKLESFLAAEHPELALPLLKKKVMTHETQE